MKVMLDFIYFQLMGFIVNKHSKIIRKENNKYYSHATTSVGNDDALNNVLQESGQYASDTS